MKPLLSPQQLGFGCGAAAPPQPVAASLLLHRMPLPFSRGSRTVCMATPKRMKMVAKQIKRELSDMLVSDKVLRHAVQPEAALGADLYVSSLATISDVEISRDLQVVKAYVSIFGDERGKEVAFEGLKAKTKYVRREIGRRVRLRRTPEIRFIEDDSYEKGSRVLAILDKLIEEGEIEDVDGGDASDWDIDEDGDGNDEDNENEGKDENLQGQG